MELWLDTIESTLIQHAVQRLALAGITTNPTILSKTTATVETTLTQLLDLQPGRVAVQVTQQDEEGMIAQAQRLYQFSDRIIVKIPVTQIGLAVIRKLTSLTIPTMATAIFSVKQIYLSGLAGAEYAAPYLTPIENEPNSATVFSDMVAISARPHSHLKIIAAAITQLTQIERCLLLGVPAITLPKPAYLALLEENALTQQKLATFNENWQQLPVERRDMLS